MFNKLVLAAAVAAAGMLMTSNEASADHCRYGRSYGVYRPGVSVYSYSSGYRSPYRSYRVPSRSYFGPGYGYHPRSNFYGAPGFGSPFYRGSYFGVGPRGGVSIGFGF